MSEFRQKRNNYNNMDKVALYIQEATAKYKNLNKKKLKSLNDTVVSVVNEYLKKIKTAAIRINVTDESLETFINYAKGEDPEQIYDRFFKNIASGKGREHVIVLLKHLLSMLVLYRNGALVTELEEAKLKAKEALKHINAIGLHGAQDDFYRILVDLNKSLIEMDRVFRDVIVYLKNIAKLQFNVLSRELGAMGLDWKQWEMVPEGVADYANTVLNDYTRPNQNKPKEEESKGQDLISSNSGYFINSLTGRPVAKDNLPTPHMFAIKGTSTGRRRKPDIVRQVLED